MGYGSAARLRDDFSFVCEGACKVLRSLSNRGQVKLRCDYVYVQSFVAIYRAVLYPSVSQSKSQMRLIE